MITRHLSILDSIIIIGSFSTVSDLKNVVTTSSVNFPHLSRAYTDSDGEYYLDKLDTTSAESLPDIIVPTSGTGRWKKINSTITNNNLIKIISLLNTNSFSKGGNLFGSNSFLGLNDNFTLNIGTNGLPSLILIDSRVTIQSPNTNNYIFVDDSSGIYLLGDNSYLNINDTQTSLNLSSSLGSKLELRFNGTTDEAIFIDSTSIPKGIQYNADYSSTFVDLSLVNKGWVTDYINTINFIPLSGTTSGNYVTGNIEFAGGRIIGNGTASFNSNGSFNPIGTAYFSGNFNNILKSVDNSNNNIFTEQSQNSNFGYYVSKYNNDYSFSSINYEGINFSTYDDSITTTYSYTLGKNGFIINTGFYNSSIFADLLSSDRIYQLPNNSGTFALISDITTSLSDYIKIDGTSPATTGYIQIGNTYGLFKNSSVYNSRSIDATIDFFKSDSGYSGDRPIRISAKSSLYTSIFSLDDSSLIYNSNDLSSSINSYTSIGTSGFYTQSVNGSNFASLNLISTGLKFRGNNPSGVFANALIQTNLYTGFSTYIYQLPNKAGTFAMLSDIPTIAGVYVAIAGDTMTGNLFTPSLGVSGTAGSGYLQMIAQSTRPSALNGYIRLYSTQTSGFGYIKRNSANLADIYREFSFPDQSITSVVQAPASGTTATLANLETAQNFTQTNRFSTIAEVAELKILDFSGSYFTALKADVSSTNFRFLGMAASSFYVGLGNNVNIGQNAITITSTAFAGGLNIRKIQPSSSGLQITTRADSGSVGLSIGGYQNISTGVYTSDMSSTSGSQPLPYNLFECPSQVRPDGQSGKVTIRSGGIADDTLVNNNNGANLEIYTRDVTGTGTSGSVFIDVGLSNTGLSGIGKKGGVVFFNNTTVPSLNSGQRIIFIGNRTASPTTNASGGTYLYSNSGNLETTGSLYFPLIGTGIGVKVGTNGRFFTATLTLGTVTVSNSSITTNTKAIIGLSPGGASGTLGFQYNYVCTSGQIVITSLTGASVTQTLDISTIQIYLIEGL